MKGVPHEFSGAGELPPDLPLTLFLTGGPSRACPEVCYPEVRTMEPFDRVILSPNGCVGRRATVDFFAGSSSAALCRLVSWAGSVTATGESQPDRSPVNVDVLELDQPARELQVLARLDRDDKDTVIRRVGVALYRSSLGGEGAGAEAGITPDFFEPVSLPVGFTSQFAAESIDGASLCCPASAVMLLRFWGVKIKLEEFARQAYDSRHRIFGNWSLTAAAISSYGMTAWVQKHVSLKELYASLRSGRPVIVSISFGPGELPEAPIQQSAGHLLVVRGYNERGDMSVCDPAGRTAASGQITYDYQTFARAWLGHGGIAIHAVPEEREG